MTRALAPFALCAALAAPLAAQQDLGAQLRGRGASPEFAGAVQELAAVAREAGLPVGPIADKAFEGLAKGYPPARVLPVLQALVERLGAGRSVVGGAGLEPPPGAVVAAAAEALGRGMNRSQVTDVIRAAPTPEAAATGLLVAASLVAQGLQPIEAAQAVSRAYREGRTSRDVLEIPSVTSSWLAQGVALPEVARRVLEGRPIRVGPGQGHGGPPPVRAVPGPPPGRGPPINPPGKGRNNPRRP